MLGISNAFIIHPVKMKMNHRALFSSSDNYADYESTLANNMRRTDIQQFLTQRSIQSFMFLLVQVRDPHTSDWVENFLDSNNLLAFHGTGALNMTRFEYWDSYFLDMMEQPRERLNIRTPCRQGGGGLRARLGGSKNNPFLQDQGKYIDNHVDIDPDALVPRILACREQIGREWAKDVMLIKMANDEIISNYEYKQQVDKNPSPAFDRTAMQILNNHMSMETFAPSPLRKGSYDLLILLSLHESIHRLLREYKYDGEKKAVSFAWLRDFFIEKVNESFDGKVNYGSGENFIEEVLVSAPSVKTIEGGIVELVDPKAIACDIIRTRSEVLSDWQEILQQVPEFHIDLRKKLLSKQINEVGKDEDTTDSFESIGAFE